MIKFIKFDYDVEKILNLLKDTIICYYNIPESGIFKKIDSVDGLNHKETIYYDNKEQDINELLVDYAQELVNDVFKEDIETKKAQSLINTTPKIKNKVVGTKEKEATTQPTAPPSIPNPSNITNQPNTLTIPDSTSAPINHYSLKEIPDAPKHPVLLRDQDQILEFEL